MLRSVKLWLLPIALLVCLPVAAMERAGGWCQLGAQTVTTVGISSTNVVQQTFPSLTVTVYVANTLTLATIYGNNSGTTKANPFTAGTDGSWYFYAANGRYDVTCTGSGQTLSFPDNLLLDLGATTGISSINSQTGPSITVQAGTGSGLSITNPSSNVIQVNLPQATSSVSGYLSSTDWSTFNSKQGALTVNAPLSLSSGTLSFTGPLSITLGGTGQITATTAFAALSPLTIVGDLLGFNGTAPTRVGVGSNGYILIADSTQPVGWRWGSCSFCSLSSPLGAANGGTGLTSGTSGGVLCATASTTYAFSSALTSGAPVIGGGAGACPGTTGPFTTYNGQTLAGQGVPAILSAGALSSAQSATVGPSNLVASAAAGLYKLCYYAVVTQAATSTSSLTPAFGWNDGTARSTTSLITANSPAFQAYTGNAAGAILSGCAEIASATGQAITYTFTYTSSGATAMNYIYAVTAMEIR